MAGARHACTSIDWGRTSNAADLGVWIPERVAALEEYFERCAREGSELVGLENHPVTVLDVLAVQLR